MLQCSATTVRGITSRVDIIWTTSNTEVRRMNGVSPNDFNTLAIYNDSFVIPSLDIKDIGSVYKCEVVINSFPPTTISDFFALEEILQQLCSQGNKNKSSTCI